jgi:FkbM family methyltransferase
MVGRFGYRLEKMEFQRYGIDPVVDIERLTVIFGIRIQRAFDVGANVGQTATALRAAFPAAEILCFEPVETTYRELSATVSGMSGVRIFNLALSDSAGGAVMHTYDSSLLSSLEADAPFTRDRVPTSTITCRKETLDAFCAAEGVDSIDLLKIDTEGHDLSVLRGAAEMLAAGRVGFVLTEFNRLDGDIGSLNATAEFLRGHGYSFICSYIDDIHPADPPFVVGNALFVRDKRSA